MRMENYVQTNAQLFECAGWRVNICKGVERLHRERERTEDVQPAGPDSPEVVSGGVS